MRWGTTSSITMWIFRCKYRCYKTINHFTQRNPRTLIRNWLKFSMKISLLCLLIVIDRVGGVRLLNACSRRSLYTWSMWDSRISLTSCLYWSPWQQISENSVALAVSRRSILNVSRSSIRNTIWRDKYKVAEYTKLSIKQPSKVYIVFLFSIFVNNFRQNFTDVFLNLK